MAELLAALKTLTVVELQSELKTRGLKKSGNKAALIKRLEEHILSAENISTAPEQEDHEENDIFKDTVQDIAVEPEINRSEDDVDDTVQDFTDEVTEPMHQDTSLEEEEEKEEEERVVSITECNNAEDMEPILQSDGDVRLFTEEHPTESNSSTGIDIDQPSPEVDIGRKDRALSVEKEESIVDDERQSAEEEKGNTDEDSNERAAVEQSPITNILHTEEAEAEDEDSVEEEERANNISIVKDDEGIQQEDVLDYEDMDDFQEPHNTDSTSNKEKYERVGSGEEVVVADREDGEVDNEENEGDNDDHKQIQEQIHVAEEKQKPKTITPVILKKRISLKAPSNETVDERAARRKRRWGSTTTTKEPSFTISSDSIKKLIPDVKIHPADLEHVTSFDQDDDVTEIFRDEEEMTNESPKKKGRTVKLDSAKKVMLTNVKDNPEPVVIESDTGLTDMSQNKPRKHSTLFHSLHAVDDIKPQEEREKSPSPPRNEASAFLHIANLVRPFTINQLKQLISQSGTICEGGFWINNIKSHCYVQLSSEDEAKTARDALHGLKWPSGNPKVLNVDFAVPDVMYKETGGAMGEQATVAVEIKDDEEADKQIDGHTERKRGRKDSEKTREKKEPAIRREEKEESPAKLLDDLFRKTKATPCIYWLPLSDAEILKRKKEQENEGAKNRDRRSREPINHANRQRSPVRRTSHPDDRRRPVRSWR